MAFMPAGIGVTGGGVMLVMYLNSASALQAVQEMSAKLQSLEQPLLEIGEMLSEEMNRKFDTAPWPPLKSSTILRKAMAGFPLDPLVRTETMKDSATGGEWSAGRMGGGSFKAVLEVPGYSRFHFEGTQFMPARDYALITSAETDKAEEILVDWLTGGALSALD